MAIFTNEGYCHCCRQEVTFTAYQEWLRDYYVCGNCGSIPRQRHLQYVLDVFFPDWTVKKLHESSPSNDALKHFCSDYSFSQFLPSVKSGDFENGIQSENVENMSFCDDYFDYFVSQDVLEHVFNPQIAAREIMRVLKPGGAHIFTAPRHRGLRQSSARAKMESGKVKFLKEAQYHENPVGDGRSLVTWDYGQDFESLWGKWSNYSVATYITRDRTLGIDAEYIDVFVQRKI